MKRILKETLIFTKRKFFDRDGLFSGAAYTIAKSHVTAVEMYRDGEPVGPYRNEIMPLWGTVPCIDATGLISRYDNEMEPYLYEGKPFNGIACTFVNGRCMEEIYFEEGEGEIEINYNPAGDLTYLFLYDNGLFQTYRYSIGEKLISAEIELLNEFTMQIKFDAGHGLSNLSISANYWDLIPGVSTKLRHHPIPSDFKPDFKISRQLFIGDKGVCPDIAFALKQCPGFADVEELYLSQPAFDYVTFVAGMKSLKSVVISDESSDAFEKAREIKLHSPDAKITLNGKELIYEVKYR